MIAMALVCHPSLLIADEPTTALDVTIQAQILDLLRCLEGELDMAILLITHDFGVVVEICDDVVVMYAGRIVEQAPVRDLFRAPWHPYTHGLIPTAFWPRYRDSDAAGRKFPASPAWRRRPAPAALVAASPIAARMCWSAAGSRARPCGRRPHPATGTIIWSPAGTRGH